MEELRSVRLICKPDDIKWKTLFCLAGAVFVTVPGTNVGNLAST